MPVRRVCLSLARRARLSSYLASRMSYYAASEADYIGNQYNQEAYKLMGENAPVAFVMAYKRSCKARIKRALRA